MGRRGHDALRCEHCRLHLPVCVCSALPRLRTRTRVVVLMHVAEQCKPSSTGRLLLRMLENSALCIHGAPSGATDATPRGIASLPVSGESAVLFPTPGAVPLEQWAERVNVPRTLIVLDGTWSQATRMNQRAACVTGLPRVALGDAPPRLPVLRALPRPGAVCTGEAVARALGILESAEAQEALYGGLRLMMERVLWLRGTLDRQDMLSTLPENLQRQRIGHTARRSP